MLDRLQQLLGWKKSYETITQILNNEFGTSLTVEDVKELKKAFQAGKTINVSKEEGFKVLSSKADYSKGETTVEVCNNKPLTKEELEKLLKIDPKVSFIKMVWLKSQTNGTWTYSALVVNHTPQTTKLNAFAEFIKTYKPSYQKPDMTKILSPFKPEHTVVISLTDFHLDKLTLKEESLQDKIKKYRGTLMSLISQTYKCFGLEKIIFVIGNDFFHTDNFNNQTTAGTPQDVSTSWFNAYEEGFKLLTWAIDYLHSFAPIHVVNVLSNHSRTKDFYLAHALEVFFQNTEDITFDRAADHTKVFNYGRNFFGFHHGDTDINKLPLYFASKHGHEWGKSPYRYIFLGDKHHKKQYKFSLANVEIEGVRINYLPSLSDTDKWHELKGFDTAVRSGLVQVYHKDKGYVAEFENRIEL